MHDIITLVQRLLCVGLQFNALEWTHSLNASVHFIYIYKLSGAECYDSTIIFISYLPYKNMQWIHLQQIITNNNNNSFLLQQNPFGKIMTVLLEFFYNH